MNANYLPKIATILESCNWLELQTGKSWSLPQLLECGLMPWFWLDYQHGWPDVLFGGRIQGYLAPVIFNGDIERLNTERREALVYMTRTYSGEIFKIDPPMRLSVDELRFLRDDIKDLVTIQNDVTITSNGLSTQPIICSSYTPSREIGVIAIKAAIQIEQDIHRRATNKEVMKLLKKRIDDGKNTDYLIKYDEKNRSIVWNTEKSTEAIYTHEACSEKLRNWNLGRKKADIE